MRVNYNHLLGDNIFQFPRTRIRANHFANEGSEYFALTRPERDAVIIKVLKKIESNPAVTGDADRWDKCWTDVLGQFQLTKNVDSLVPPFVIRGQECRMFGDYVKPTTPHFEEEVDEIIRTYLFEKYVNDGDTFYEFGCGSCWNLALLTDMYPYIEAIGVEWSHASVELANEVGRTLKRNITGHWFDMFNPSGLNLRRGSVVFTHGTMEQMGTNWKPFLDFLLESHVGLIIHVECIEEFYRPDVLADTLALQFHRKRNYLSGYYSWLQGLEQMKKIYIHKAQHVQFGSLYQDGFSIIVWEPRYV